MRVRVGFISLRSCSCLPLISGKSRKKPVIAAGPTQARCPSSAHGIRLGIKSNNRNGLCRLRHSIQREGIDRDDDVDPLAHEPRGKGRVLLDLLTRSLNVYDNVLADNVSGFPQAGRKALERRRLGLSRDRTAERSDSRYLLLRLCDERQKNHADSDNDREPNPPHAGGSLAERYDAHQQGGALARICYRPNGSSRHRSFRWMRRRPYPVGP
jgi:hypothetical protein